MNQYVEYAMKIKDMASGPLGAIANSFDKVTAHANKAGKSSSMFSNMLSGAFNLSNIFGAAQGIIGVAQGIGEKIGSTIQASMDREQLQISFDVLTGSKEAGKKLTDQLVNLQKDTILGGEVFKNAQTMLGFGFKDTEILENMRMLGDISMGDAEKLNSLTLAFSQVRSAGKLQGQDLMQLINAGFNPLEAMSQRTGKSIATLKDEMSKGNISFEMVQQAFKDATSEGGRYNNMLATIAKSDVGMKAQLGGGWDEVKIKIGDAFKPLTHMGLELGLKLLPVFEKLTVPLSNGMQKFADLLSSAIQKVGQMRPAFDAVFQPFKNMFDQIKNSIGGFADYLEPVRILFVERIFPCFAKISKLITSMVGGIVSFVGQSELLKDVFSVVGYLVGRLYNSISEVVDAFQWMWDNIIMPILNGIEAAYRWLKGSSVPVGSHKKIDSKPKASATPTTAENQTTAKLAEIAKNTQANAKAGKEASNAVSSAGPKVINISVNKFFDNIQFNTTNLNESVAHIENVVLECLSRVLVQGATTA